jgi:hypothetical protein
LFIWGEEDRAIMVLFGRWDRGEGIAMSEPRMIACTLSFE